jgi:hypothetical protein
MADKAPERKPKKCPCAYEDCDRHGNCDACKAYHRATGSKTTCERAGEKT